ncbi:Hypoxia up-regulated protein 1 [Smittium culicis]|uniref:Hypoxia up-regulated protein 1 n=1 Tax=Smittium culicis TaxID=133412 RepID=A0A1R1YH45_9FUNG|nr:Hypoxia up-regulated protein 1 [Smittium culicis]OMJ28862.1 Hypoxia up-regulated protein 1 [Smittium culicis]
MKFSSTFASTFFVLFCCYLGVDSAVLGIDYGADTFKVALANPGRPMDIVLNRDSKRKTPSALYIKGYERLFGSDAVSVSGKRPENTLLEAKSILGASYDDKIADSYRRKYGHKMLRTGDGSIVFDLGLKDNRYLSVQDIIAMQLRHALELVKESEKINAKDAIVSIPSHFGQFERQAMKDAIEISGVNPLGLINDGSSVALNFAMGKEFTANPVTHMFVDMGAASTVVTVAQFKSKLTKVKGVSKNITVVDNVGYASDETLGGSEMDNRLREFIISKFEAAKKDEMKKSVRDNKRAMARALKEANRIKTILTVNSEVHANLESFHEDIDFSLKVTKSDFEKLIDDLASHFANTIEKSLKLTKMSKDAISSVIIAGGGSRVPYMIRKLSDIFGKEKISRNINADEAGVIGSVFRAAGMSSQFRVKDIRLRDSYGYAIQASYEEESSGLFGKSSPVKNLILPKFSTIGVKRILSTTRKTDFTIDFESETEDGFELFATASISGVPDAIKKNDESLVLNPKPEIEVSYTLNKFGIFEVTGANAVFNMTNTAYPEYLVDLKKWNKEQADIAKASKSAKEASKSSSSDSESSAETASESSAESEAESPNDSKSKVPKSRPMPTEQKEFITKRIPLRVRYTLTKSNALTSSDIKSSTNIIKRIEISEENSRILSTAKNNLESFIYKLKYFVEEDATIEVTNETQRKELLAASSEAAEWLDNNSELEKPALYDEQRKKLEFIYNPVAERLNYYKSISTKMDDITEFKRQLADTEKSLVEFSGDNAKWFNKETTDPKFIPEIEEVEKLKIELAEKVEKIDNFVSFFNKSIDGADKSISPEIPLTDFDKAIEAAKGPMTKLQNKFLHLIIKIQAAKEDLESLSSKSASSETASSESSSAEVESSASESSDADADDDDEQKSPEARDIVHDEL